MNLQTLTIQVTEAIQHMRSVCKEDHAGRVKLSNHGTTTGYVLFSSPAAANPYRVIGMNALGQLFLHAESLDEREVSAKQVDAGVLVQWALDECDQDLDAAAEELFDACYFAVWDASTRKVPGAREVCGQLADVFGRVEPIAGELVAELARKSSHTATSDNGHG